MIEHYNRRGEPITMERWAELFEDMDYKIVKRTEFDDGDVKVSTVWLGLDHRTTFGRGQATLLERPIIFETMIFGLDPENELQWRYSTEEEARAHHDRLCEQLREGVVVDELG